MSTAAGLMEAVRARVPAIEVEGAVRGMPMLTLAPGVRLRGGTVEFGAKGVRLTRGNVLEDVSVRCPEHEAAILDDTSVAGLGTLTLRGVRATGQVLPLARDAVRSGHVAVDGPVVEAADVRGRVERPHGCGVDALQGALTPWNRQPDPAVEITAELPGLSAGSAGRPVRGSGVFVGGHGDRDGAGDGFILVRGVQREPAAVALSVKAGGRIGTATVGGRIATSGDHLTTVGIDGEVGSLTVTGGVHAAGQGADAVRIGAGDVDPTGIDITTAAAGRPVVHRAES